MRWNFRGKLGCFRRWRDYCQLNHRIWATVLGKRKRLGLNARRECFEASLRRAATSPPPPRAC